MPEKKFIKLELTEKDAKGSRLRCLMLTSTGRTQVITTLNRLVSGIATVSNDDFWMPQGFLAPDEIQLTDPPSDLPERIEGDWPLKLRKWWLAKTSGAVTPNWDLVTTCKIEDQPGLLLIEAKAHSGELDVTGKRRTIRLVKGKRVDVTNPENEKQIIKAIAEANEGLNRIVPGFNLSTKSHYQLANRFAWTWKLAELNIPTVLIYLGFLNAEEMAPKCQPFRTVQDWEVAFRNYLVEPKTKQSIVPEAALNSKLKGTGAPFWALTSTLEQRWVPSAESK